MKSIHDSFIFVVVNVVVVLLQPHVALQQQSFLRNPIYYYPR